VHFRRAMSEDLLIRIEVPKGYEVEGMPESMTAPLQTGFATYQLQIKQQDGRHLEIQRRIRYEPAVLPAEEYQLFRDTFYEISKLEKSTLVFVKKRT